MGKSNIINDLALSTTEQVNFMWRVAKSSEGRGREEVFTFLSLKGNFCVINNHPISGVSVHKSANDERIPFIPTQSPIQESRGM